MCCAIFEKKNDTVHRTAENAFQRTFLLKKNHIQTFQQTSIMRSLVRPADDILDTSTGNTQKYVDILKVLIKKSHILLFLSVPYPVQTVHTN